VWRIQQVIESEKIEADLENERDERKKKNIQTYKKSKKNNEIVDI
jgi:hypothetical protein